MTQLRRRLTTETMSGVEKDTRIAIKLYFRNEFGSEYEMSKTADTYPDLGEDTISMLARTINLFLRHIGYSVFDKDMVLLESITEEEYEILQSYLFELRNGATEDTDE